MNKLSILSMVAICGLLSCHPEKISCPAMSRNDESGSSKRAIDTASGLIPIDSANKMILSYLASTNHTANDTDIQSLIINAGPLKELFSCSSSVVSLKFMFAHKLDYINSGMYGIAAGYKRNALTVVVTGVDAAGNYVVFPAGTALNKSMPCPTSCPQGSASNSLITTTPAL